jgi:hypothetical protein
MMRSTFGLVIKMLLCRLLPIVSFLTACSVDTKNWTPKSFPFDLVNDGPSETSKPLYNNTPSKLVELLSSPAHRFLLEVKPNNVTVRTVRITVNGSDYAMTPVSGSHLYSYQSPSECNQRYSYFMTVDYAVNFPYSVGPARVGSTENPLVADVAGFGALVWWVISTEAQSGDGTVRIVEGTGDVPVVLQNLSASRRRVGGFGFSSTDPVASHFSVVDRPTLPAVLNCGDKVSFKVRWSPGSPPEQTDMVIFTDTEISPGNWRHDQSPIVITLQAVAQPG